MTTINLNIAGNLNLFGELNTAKDTPKPKIKSSKPIALTGNEWTGDVIDLTGKIIKLTLSKDPTLGLKEGDIAELNPRYRNSYDKGEIPISLTVVKSYVKQLGKKAYAGIIKFAELDGIYVTHHFKKKEL